MNTVNEVITELLGSYKASFYITYLLFLVIGILASLKFSSLSRDKSSPSTPFKFSWKFLVQDNLIRFLGSIAIVFLSIRLGEDLFGYIPTYTGATLMGLGFDQTLGLLQKVQLKARN